MILHSTQQCASQFLFIGTPTLLQQQDTILCSVGFVATFAGDVNLHLLVNRIGTMMLGNPTL